MMLKNILHTDAFAKFSKTLKRSGRSRFSNPYHPEDEIYFNESDRSDSDIEDSIEYHNKNFVSEESEDQLTEGNDFEANTPKRRANLNRNTEIQSGSLQNKSRIRYVLQ